MTTAPARVHIIAEIGTAHGGSKTKAKKLIDAAVSAGADSVKFQWVYAHEILHPATGYVPLPAGNISLYERFRGLEVPPSFFAEMRDYARSKGVFFICSPFGKQSLLELIGQEPDALKIASPELNHIPLLRTLAGQIRMRHDEGKRRIPLILSSGVSLLADIEKALSCIQPCEDIPCAPDTCLPAVSLLHCITAYPAPETEYNVRLIENLSRIFGIPVGISDHSLDPALIPVLSVLYGGRIIEKHITLSRKTEGLDDPVALETGQFAEMTEQVRLAEQTLLKCGTEAGKNILIEKLCERCGRERVQAAIGSGVKKLAPAELQNYGRTNRSIHFMRDMQPGDRIRPQDVAVLRTEKILDPGIAPEYEQIAAGSLLARPAKAGEGLKWEHLLSRVPPS